MRRALDLAILQHGRTAPNPSVGCVILDRDGSKISEAATGDGGHPHAEELALADLPIGAAAGGTAYVTLEPCRERTRSLSCCIRAAADEVPADALRQALISSTRLCTLADSAARAAALCSLAALPGLLMRKTSLSAHGLTANGCGTSGALATAVAQVLSGTFLFLV